MTVTEKLGAEFEPLTDRQKVSFGIDYGVMVKKLESNSKLGGIGIGENFIILKVNDKDYNHLNFFIHDYFFAKTIDKVRPGGIVALVTSKGTLDKQDRKLRELLSEKTNLIGAVRLPNTAFKTAGTKVTSDIIFLQKKKCKRWSMM